MATPLERRFTAIESRGGEVVVHTDEGDESPIVVPNHRLEAVVLACLDALRGKNATR